MIFLGKIRIIPQQFHVMKNANELKVTQPAHNIPRALPYGLILVEASDLEPLFGPSTTRFLTCFGFAVSGMHLASGDIEKFP